jgi:hypothetical protein
LSEVQVAYDSVTDQWHFEIVDVDGTVLMFQLDCENVIGLIRAIKRETQNKISWKQPFKRPLLRLITGNDG